MRITDLLKKSGIALGVKVADIRQYLSHRSKLSFYSLQPFHNHFTFFLAKSNSVCKNIISSFIS